MLEFILGVIFGMCFSFVLFWCIYQSDMSYLIYKCKRLREAALWFADNTPGAPVPDWVDDAVNGLDSELID